MKLDPEKHTCTTCKGVHPPGPCSMSLADPPGPGWHECDCALAHEKNQGWTNLPENLDPYVRGIREYPEGFTIHIDWRSETAFMPPPQRPWTPPPPVSQTYYPPRAPEPPRPAPRKHSKPAAEDVKQLFARKPPPEEKPAPKKAKPAEKLGPPTVEVVGNLRHTERLSERAKTCKTQHAYRMKEDAPSDSSYALVCDRCGSEKEIGPA